MLEQNNNMKEVYFSEYCKTCINFDKKEDEDPCHDCLNEPARENSHKPLHYKKAMSKKEE